MSASRGVPLVRVAAEERVYEREAVLGRDATSVFPSSNPAPSVGVSAFESMGAVKFVTETQLTELKAMRGERIEDGTLAPADKSLAEVLADNKAKKEEEFQAVWTSMKVGKNRPLDEDEAGFYNDLAKQEWFAEKSKTEAEANEMLAFRLARETQMVSEVVDPKTRLDPSLLAPPGPVATKRPAPAVRVQPMAKVKIVPKKAGAAAVAKPVPKNAEESDEEAGGLLGVAAYGSDSD
jgi:hypothetical protein